ncbi:MAG: hypothetical protein EBR82_29910 [Caulobacteraceae bacterium]|nr:hypothetical protein [Caulobacteraceae bacterium]
MVEPIVDGATYTKELLRDRHGIGTRAWNRLVKAGMPVDRIGNRVFQRGEVIREWIARVAADKRASRAHAQDLAGMPATDGGNGN